MENVIEKIAKKDKCVGCGICVTVCPKDFLEMDFNFNGEYNPRAVDEKKCINCAKCLHVCTFFQDNKHFLSYNKFNCVNGVNYNKYLGYYLNNYAGYVVDDEIRTNSASGGITTWLLEKMVQKELVDYVIIVKPNDDPEKLYKYQIIDQTKDIKKGSKSVYYPVELSEVLNKVLNKSGRYAIVGLPCFLNGIELAKKQNKLFKERIIYMIGLTCGQLKNKHFTLYLAQKAGIEGELKKIIYRGKDFKKPANNYYFTFINQQGSENHLYFKKDVSTTWVNRWFSINACNYCDDVFAELADVSLMDAWLPNYIKDSKGTNLLIVRNPEIENVLEEGEKEREIKLDKVKTKDVIRSQNGVIDFKRNQLPYRLKLNRTNNTNKIVYNPLTLKEVQYKQEMQELSKVLFRENFHDMSYKLDVKSFDIEMSDILKKVHRVNKVKRISLIPKRVLKKIKTISFNILL
ncbi:Coenzyme F420 hydrogenase/dehydrogenase, beta subunit C-terminal domain [Natranaerobius trueperi]|uniref:4Fe-4S ferredoxin n=1 Tax=Natranaerobius trueperi TaxID=759412 RepID=A0A226BW93_9FIRM|nr:Coenzyme F420 hydrogenase/dehydrogenase, beta subunit C-terminal domain [Natranaerobius trueperi]OWZ83235.1 4Fe-4S ferredoxin [Natranaerobius trueperi]